MSNNLLLKFTNSSLPQEKEDKQRDLSGQALLEYRSEAALRLHHTRLAGLSDRWTLSFLLLLSLALSWLIGYFQASSALLVLLGVGALFIGRGRWQQAVEGARLEAELKAQRKMSSQLRGESAEWINFLLNRCWTTCSSNILAFAQEHIEPLIGDLLPSGIDKVEVVEVDFGQQTPSISNVKLSDVPTSKSKTLDLNSSSTCNLIMNFDLLVSAPDSRIVLRARLGGKSFWSSHLVYVNGLYLSGRVQALIMVDSHASFPHVSKIAATFTSKPDIWFSVKVLKGLKVTNIPLLKNFVHSIVMDVFSTLLVDPGKLTLNIGPSPYPQDHLGAGKAEGVLTVCVTGRAPLEGRSQHEGDPRRWISLRLGVRKFKQKLSLSRHGIWKQTYSFLVHQLQQDVLVIKIKMKRIVYSSTLAEHSIALDSLGLLNQQGEESMASRLLKFSNAEAVLEVSLQYTPLPSLSLHTLNGLPPVSQNAVCGVLYVHVHRGLDLRGCDSNGLSDPYCVVQANKHKIFHTHHMSNTLSPSWEEGLEVFVSDITKVTLTFLVFDWDGPLVDDDFLGVAKLSLQDAPSELIQHELALTTETKEVPGQQTEPEPQPCPPNGKVIVSIVFRAVSSVGRATPECHVTTASPELAESVPVKKSIKVKKKDVGKLGGLGSAGVLEVQLLRGHDLVAKDSNGLSDPYVLIKYGTNVMFRSKVVKKSLNPEWNQVVSLSAPNPQDSIVVECWDKDIFSDDFMGSVHFTAKDLHIFKEGEQWCRLEQVKHGQLLLRFMLSEERSEQVRWSHLDEASRQLIGDVSLQDDQQVGGSVLMRSPSQNSLTSSSHSSSFHGDDSSDMGSNSVAGRQLPSFKSSSHVHSPRVHSPRVHSPMHHENHTPSSATSDSSSLQDTTTQQQLRRRHTLSHQPRPPDFSQYPETKADIEWALNRVAEGGGARQERKEKLMTVYHNVSGQVIEATGLRGELDHMELYVKIRLNTRPSYQRQHKFGRGPVVHKTRVLRGSHSPQWREDFMVKESPVPSDSLLTLDLKSGSKVNIGTYAITLDKFFEGQLKATRAFDIGNDVKLRVKMSRQLH